MKTKLAFGSILLLVLFALSASHFTSAEEKADKAAEMEVRGTVVDLHCYVTHGIRDAAHTGCANACIARESPPGSWPTTGPSISSSRRSRSPSRIASANLADVPAVVHGTISPSATESRGSRCGRSEKVRS